MKLKSLFSRLTALLIGLTGALAIAEAVARVTEPKPVVHGRTAYVRHPELGWLPSSGEVTISTHEYRARYSVNSLGMNDRPVEETVARSRIRMLALGDSHTFAVGVTQDETWPKILQQLMFHGVVEAGTVYNGGVVGYSLGQYLLRMRQLVDVIRPQVVLVGFSMATDLYDLIPPHRGGFVYGQEFSRIYFDLDQHQGLVERRDLVGKDLKDHEARASRSISLTVREVAGHFALYRRLKRSTAALWVATHFHPQGESLWPGLDTALKRRLNAEDQYRWRLAERLIEQISREALAQRITVVLVNIPYLAQVYDEVWESSFGTFPQTYDRWIAGERLGAICERSGVLYVDATQDLAKAAKARRVWLHYREDGHPTAEGHRIIAEAVSRALKEAKVLENVVVHRDTVLK